MDINTNKHQNLLTIKQPNPVMVDYVNSNISRRLRVMNVEQLQCSQAMSSCSTLENQLKVYATCITDANGEKQKLRDTIIRKNPKKEILDFLEL